MRKKSSQYFRVVISFCAITFIGVTSLPLAAEPGSAKSSVLNCEVATVTVRPEPSAHHSMPQMTIKDCSYLKKQLLFCLVYVFDIKMDIDTS